MSYWLMDYETRVRLVETNDFLTGADVQHFLWDRCQTPWADSLWIFFGYAENSIICHVLRKLNKRGSESINGVTSTLL